MNKFIPSIFLFLLHSVCSISNGLGGAVLNLTCYPVQVSLGEPFYVNANYSIDEPRIVDIHLDVLNAETKQWYAGTQKTLYSHSGSVSLGLTIPEAQNPLMWKVFITPTLEPFPNMLAETGFNAPLGSGLITACQIIPDTFQNGTFLDSNYVLLDRSRIPKLLVPDKIYSIPIYYNLLQSDTPTQINISIMKKDTNTVLSYNNTIARVGKNLVQFDLPVPDYDGPIYIISSLVKINGTWQDRYAEDRTYNVKIYH